MEITDKKIDGGKAFDWGKTSENYAKYRDIYPMEFYDRIISRRLCIEPQSVLDLGTGTGVIPRTMYKYGAKWTAADISAEQIEQARILSARMNIKYLSMPAEELTFPDNSFDTVTACQCFWYFNHEKLMPKLFDILKPDGSILIMYMAWLPFEDKIAGESEKLVLRYNPKWSGAGETVHPIRIPDIYSDRFELVYHEEFPLKVHFTRESWNGRMCACRGVGASLSSEEAAKWEREHIEMLKKTTPDEFDILHYAAFAQLKKK